MVAVYPVLFALRIALFTNARRAEIYGAAAAYCDRVVATLEAGATPEQSMRSTDQRRDMDIY
jgi:hypothetical protein